MRAKAEKVGITGGSGFIGNNLCKLFDKENINYCRFTGDLLKDEDVEKFFIDNRVTQIVHLAGDFFPPFNNLIEKNLFTTEKLLDIGFRFGLKKMIYSSTGAVYGEPVNKESYESDSLRPNTLYGLSKLYAEECIVYYQKKFNVQYVILRFPNVYGKENKKGVIFNLLKDIKEKGYVTIAGDGNQSRNFLHVSDACLSIEKALDYKSSDIFNISNPVKVTVNDLVKILSKDYGFKIKYENEDNGLRNILLNTDKALRKLKFASKIKNIQLW